MTGMIGVSCARHDKNVRPDYAHMTYHLIDSVLGMDGDNDASRLQYAAGFEERRISRITVVNQMAFTAVKPPLKTWGAGIERSRRHPVAFAGWHPC